MPIQRGEIYFVNLNPVEGREQAGNRPVLVLSRDAINRLIRSIIAVPLIGSSEREANASIRLPTSTCRLQLVHRVRGSLIRLLYNPPYKIRAEARKT